MRDGTKWQRAEAETRISEVLDAAKDEGTQKVIDVDGTFNVSFVPRKGTIEQLFATPGTIVDE